MSGGGKGPSVSEQKRLAEEEARKSELRRQRELAAFSRARGGALRGGMLASSYQPDTLLGGGTSVKGGRGAPGGFSPGP